MCLFQLPILGGRKDLQVEPNNEFRNYHSMNLTLKSVEAILSNDSNISNINISYAELRVTNPIKNNLIYELVCPTLSYSVTVVTIFFGTKINNLALHNKS